MKTKIITIVLLAISSITTPLIAQETAVFKTKTKSNQSNDRTAGYDLKKGTKLRVIPTENGCSLIFDNIGGISRGAVAEKKGYDYYKSMSSFSVSSIDNSVSIVSPRDAASGLPTGKRQHKPLSHAQETENGSSSSTEEISIGEPGVQATQKTGGGGAGKATFSDLSVMSAGKATFKEFTVTKRCDGKTTKISCPDGECDIPLDECPNGTCDLVCSWSWGVSNPSSSSSSSISGRCDVSFSLEVENGVCHAVNQKGTPGGSSTKK